MAAGAAYQSRAAVVSLTDEAVFEDDHHATDSVGLRDVVY